MHHGGHVSCAEGVCEVGCSEGFEAFWEAGRGDGGRGGLGCGGRKRRVEAVDGDVVFWFGGWFDGGA